MHAIYDWQSRSDVSTSNDVVDEKDDWDTSSQNLVPESSNANAFDIQSKQMARRKYPTQMTGLSTATEQPLWTSATRPVGFGHRHGCIDSRFIWTFPKRSLSPCWLWCTPPLTFVSICLLDALLFLVVLGYYSSGASQLSLSIFITALCLWGNVTSPCL